MRYSQRAGGIPGDGLEPVFHSAAWRLRRAENGVGATRCIALARTDSMPTLCSARRSPAKTPGDFPLLVERDIEQKARVWAQRDIAHFLPNWVTLGEGESGTRAPSFSQSSSGFVPVGCGSTASTAAFSSGKPACGAGSMMMVRSAGSSTYKWPRP